MKAKTILLLSTFISIIYLGGAYASYWEQDISTSGTVDTGELSIKVENEKVTTPDYVQGEIEDAAEEMDQTLEQIQQLETLDLTGSDNDFSVTIENMYPGSSIVQEFDVVNTGTLGIYLDDITIDVLQAGNNCDWDSDDIDEDEACSCGHIQLDKEMKIEFKKSAEGSTSGYKTLSELLQETYLDEIPDGESRTYSIKITFDEDKSLKENELESTNVIYKFHIHFKQFNEMNIQETSKD